MKYKNILFQCLADESGVMAFEWVLLAILLSVGIVGGLAAFRDMAVLQFGNVATAAGHLDQSCGYSGCPLLTDTGYYEDTRAKQTSIMEIK